MSELVDDSSLRDSLSLEEYEFLRENAALVDSRSADWLRVFGADRLRFANGLASCDLRSIGPGDGVYGFFTNPKGKIVAEAVFLGSESDLWVEVPRGLGQPVADHLSRYLVADQVEIEVLPAWKTVFVVGPEAGPRLEETLGDLVQDEFWSGSVLETGAGRLLARADRRFGVPAWVLAGAGAAVESVMDGLREGGLGSAGPAAVAAVRIEHSVPWFGLDFGPEGETEGYFPQETGIEDWAVSFEKGCYLGQEVIARIHFRGKVNRSLRGLIFDPGSEPRAGAELGWNDEVVGIVNSIADSPAMGRPIGLAIVHHKAVPGSELTASAGSCRLVELPFSAG